MALTIIFTGAIQFWLSQRQHPLADVWLLGTLIGLIFITKMTAYLMFPLVLLVIILATDNSNIAYPSNFHLINTRSPHRRLLVVAQPIGLRLSGFLRPHPT